MAYENDPRAALDAVAQTDRRLAKRMHWSLPRHAAAGLLQALCVISWAVPIPLAIVTILLVVGGVVWISHSDRKRDGMFVNGWSSRAARPAFWLAIAATLAGFALLAWAAPGLHMWTPLGVPIALGVFVVVTASSIWWERLYHADLDRSASGAGAT
ncbi:hypothetical protein [Qipengyuania marisflavi]|uniref:Transmembrane protein n=1 Tax=Qipengyuania marisflavi TaxID=2486356 RepID=A0A5S3P1L1_9SPHN|nr:hypothetical protein [Qipengyuania marisflavi]TMM46575.1 hypothetical protein FEV51_11065 [Qipengyuania marisflavi]